MSSCAWQFDDVKEILNRRFQLKERAIEIFLVNGQTHLLAFQSAEVSKRDSSYTVKCFIQEIIEKIGRARPISFGGCLAV